MRVLARERNATYLPSRESVILPKLPSSPWVPSLLTRLDWVAKNWIRADKGQAPFSRKPSETLREQMAFTPFVFEDVGVLIDQSSPDLYLFSSDCPHSEGGRDPIGKFERHLDGRSEAVKGKFYSDNFLRLFPEAA